MRADGKGVSTAWAGHVAVDTTGFMASRILGSEVADEACVAIVVFLGTAAVRWPLVVAEEVPSWPVIRFKLLHHTAARFIVFRRDFTRNLKLRV